MVLGGIQLFLKGGHALEECLRFRAGLQKVDEGVVADTEGQT